MRLMREIHEGLCVAHISGPMMMLIRHGYYWPTITIDFYWYARGCEECQRSRPLLKTPAKEMHAIVKPWPFKGWVMC